MQIEISTDDKLTGLFNTDARTNGLSFWLCVGGGGYIREWNNTGQVRELKYNTISVYVINIHILDLYIVESW